jgi:predicted transcriptional regulator YdeE
MMLRIDVPLTRGVLMLTLLLGICLSTTLSAFAAPATAPQAEGRTLTGYDSPQFQAKQYAYVRYDGHVEELYIVAGSQWQVADLSARAGAPPTLGYTLAGYDSPQFQAKQYAYVDTNGHVEELSIVAGGQWQVTDLSSIT